MAKVKQQDFRNNFHFTLDCEDMKAVEHIAAARQVPIPDVLQAAFHSGLITLCIHDTHHTCRMITQERKQLPIPVSAALPGYESLQNTNETPDNGVENLD